MHQSVLPAIAPDLRAFDAVDYHDVLPVIRTTEMLETWLPRILMTIFVGLPILLGLLHGHPALGLINAFLCRVVAILLLAPLHAFRYARVVGSLAATLDGLAPDAMLRIQWIAGAPGALAITRLSTLLLVDRSTSYRFVSLADEEIVAVDRSIAETLRTTSRSRPGLVFGFPIGRFLFGGWTFGGRTVSDTRVTTSHSILLRYQREHDAAIRCAIIPFGPDEVGAENLRITIDRLRAARAV